MTGFVFEGGKGGQGRTTTETSFGVANSVANVRTHLLSYVRALVFTLAPSLTKITGGHLRPVRHKKSNYGRKS